MRHVQIINRWNRIIEDFYINDEPAVLILRDAILSWTFAEDDLPLSIHFNDRKWHIDEFLKYADTI